MSHTHSRTRNAGFGRKLAAALALGVAGGAMSLALVAPAQAQESNASLSGRITGAEGVTQVTAVEVNTGIRRTATVDAEGNYNFAALRPGAYRLEIATASGVRSTDEFTLAVAQDAALDFDLGAVETAPAEPGTEVAEATGNEIIVVADRIRTMEGGEIGVTITERMIEQLPQTNRNFLAFADLAPGVAFITGANGDSRIQGGAQASRSVNVFIDGVGQKDYVLKNGITGQDSSQGNPFPQLAIGEYRVISSNYKAEFDQVSSTAITAVTKSGTNEFHGDLFVDFSNQDLRAKTPLEKDRDEEKTETQDFQFGGALGGPIIEDMLHFFVTYEGKRQQEPVEVTPGGGRTVESFPEEYQQFFGGFNRRFTEDLYFGKIDFVPSDRDLFEISVKYRDETGVNWSGGRNASSVSTDINNNEIRGLFRYERTEDNWINDFKITYEKAQWAPTPRVFENGYVFRDNDNATLLVVGGSANYQDKGQKGWGIQDDFTWIGFDNHTIKLGFKAKWVTLNTLQLNLTNASYDYNVDYNPGPDGFNDEVPYRVRFGALTGDNNPIIESENFQLGLYIQDDWDVTDRLTLNLGIRWDYEETPAYLNYVTSDEAVAAVSPEFYPNLIDANYDINDYISTGNEREPFLGAFQPRIGFSYELDDTGRFVLFGGYGRSYDRNQFDFIQQELSIGSFATRTFNFDTGDPENTCTGSTCVPFDPIYLTEEGRQMLLAGIEGSAAGLRFINNDLKMPYSDQFSLGLRRSFGLLDAEIGYSHVESRDGFAYLLGNRLPDGNFFELVDTDGDDVPDTREIRGAPFGFSPDGYGSITIGTNGIETNADSAYLKLVKRYTPTSPWNLNVTYTYTQAEENREFGEYFSFDYPSLDDYAWLPSAGVSKHRLVAAGAVDLPLEFTLSGKLTLQSPPYLQGVRGEPGFEVPVAIEGKGKEAFILGDFWAKKQIDLALTKYIPFDFLYDGAKLRFRIDVLNVLNEANYTGYNGSGNDDTRTENSPTIFGEQTGLGIGGNPPRTVKVSAGFSF